MNFTVNDQEKFQINSAVHSIKQRLNSIFTEKLPAFHAFRKVLCQHKKIQQVSLIKRLNLKHQQAMHIYLILLMNL